MLLPLFGVPANSNLGGMSSKKRVFLSGMGGNLLLAGRTTTAGAAHFIYYIDGNPANRIVA